MVSCLMLQWNTQRDRKNVSLKSAYGTSGIYFVATVSIQVELQEHSNTMSRSQTGQEQARPRSCKPLLPPSMFRQHQSSFPSTPQSPHQQHHHQSALDLNLSEQLPSIVVQYSLSLSQSYQQLLESFFLLAVKYWPSLASKAVSRKQSL